MTRMRYVKMDRIMNHMLIHALREVFRQEKEQGLPVDTTRDLVLKLAEQEEGKLYLTEAEHSKSVEALNQLRDIPEKRTLFRWDRQRPVKDHEIQIPPIPWKGKMKKGCGTNIQKYDTRKNRSHAEKISAGNRGHA